MVPRKELSQKLFNEIKLIGSIRPTLYGLPKLHKREVSLRPVLSMTKSLKHKLARFLNLLLDPVLNEYSIIIVKEFLKLLSGLGILIQKILISFDVKMLFTNIRLDEVIQILSEVL